MEKVLTIVIPTYNMEKYLHRCLDSLKVDSSLMDILEVLVINDGSKDSSSQIAHEYEKEFPNTFRVIDKENANYGSCINRGIDEASGKYFKILDADDWYDCGELSKLLQTLKNKVEDGIDVFYTNFTYHNFNTNVDTKHEFTIVEYGKVYQLGNIDFVNSPDWFMMKMYSVAIRTEILRQIELRLDTGISYTDNEYMYFPYSHINNVCFLNLNVYQYFIGREGQTIGAKITEKHLNAVLKIANRTVDDYIQRVENVKSENHKKAMTQMAVERCVAYFDQALSMPKTASLNDSIKGLYSKVKENKILLQNVQKKSKGLRLWELTGLYKSNKLIATVKKILK